MRSMRRMRKTRINLSILLLAAVFMLLAACGKSSAPSDGGNGSSNTASSANDSAGSSGAAASDEKVTLKFITLANWTAIPNIEKALEPFYKDNPNIKVEFESVPFADLDKKIITANAGGVTYDLITVNHPSVGTFVDSGILEPLDNYVQASGIDMSQYNPSFASSTIYKDKQWAMPFETDCRVLGINEKLFQEAGLEPPKTTADMLAAAKALTKDLNGDGKPDQFGMMMDFSNMWTPTYDWGQWLLGNGVQVYTEENGKYKSTINSPGTIDFLNWAMEMSQYQPKDFVSYDGQKITAAISQNKVGMFIMGPWSLSDPVLNAAKDFKYKLVLNPTGSVKSASSMGGWHFGIGAKSKHKEAAWKVLEFLSKPEVSAATVSALPPQFKAFDFPPYNDAKFDIFKEQLKTAQLPAPAIKELPQIAELWNKSFQRIILKDAKSEQELPKLDQEIQKILDNRK